MEYTKPEIVGVIPAMSAICGGKEKGVGALSDAPLYPPLFRITPGAYEADEVTCPRSRSRYRERSGCLNRRSNQTRQACTPRGSNPGVAKSA